MHSYIEDIATIFKANANTERAAWSKAYMLNQFEFYGLVTAKRRKLSKTYMQNNTLTSLQEIEAIVKECFEQTEREYQYFAIELMHFYKKLWKPSSIKILEYCLVHKSWWDSVDHVASECLTIYFTRFPSKIEPITSKWNQSNNIWLQRSSILFQKAFKAETNVELLSQYILHCATSKEFFIQKAIGWALREYSKTNPSWVNNFVATNNLAALSKREALKRIGG
jgi:3-methyladenine DNA glycosylase AlkD